MPDTELLVREYWSWIITENPAPDAEQVISSAKATSVPIGDGCVRPLTPLPTERSVRRRWAVLAAAAAVVLAVLAPVLLLSGGPDSDVGRAEPEVATTVPSTTALQVATPSDVAGWSRVPHDETVFGGEGSHVMSSVAVGGPGLVAVGMEGSAASMEGEGERVAAVWTSVDGITWSRVPHDESVFGGDNAQWMDSVTSGGPGLVAVGMDGSIGEAYGWTPMFGGVAAVWTSVDGTTWTRVPHDEAVFGGEGVQSMSSVTAGGPGLVAVGSVASVRSDGEILNEVAAVWISVDGTTWTRVPHDEAAFGDGTESQSQRMNSVIAAGPGLVAVGEAHGSAAVWTSVDGITWSRVPHDEAAFGDGTESQFQRMNSVIAAGPGLLVVGFGPTGETPAPFSTDAAVWTSVDGITWSRLAHDEAVFGGVGDHEMFGVAVGGRGLVSVGRAGRGAGQGAGVWTSVDGITWTRIPHEQAVFGGRGHQVMWSVTASGPDLVAVGLDDRLDNEKETVAAVWLAATED